MHFCRSWLLFILVVSPATATAQRARLSAERATDYGMSVSPARVLNSSLVIASDSNTSSRSHHVAVGAATGAVIGVLAGVVGSAFLHVGCTRDPCHDTRGRVGLAVWFGSLGGIAGGVLGAGVGALIPAPVHPRDSNSAPRLPNER